MQWIDLLREFPYESDCQPMSKKDSKLLEKKIVRDKAYFSSDLSTRRTALKWLDCSASLNKNYKEKFLYALPGYMYLIPEIGRGLFLCISSIITFSDDIAISSDLYKNRLKYNKDIYVFININVPDKPFLVTRRMLSIFYGRCPLENAGLIIESTINKIKRRPQILSSALTILDMVDSENTLINPHNKNDLILIEKTIEGSIKAEPGAPITVEKEGEKITKLINEISNGKLSRVDNENSKELYVDWLLEASLDNLREKLPPEAFAALDHDKLRENIVSGIQKSIDTQMKQTEDWYADETSVIIPNNSDKGRVIEMPNIPVDGLNRWNFNRTTGVNLIGKYDPSTNTNSLNTWQTEIVEIKKRSWGEFLSEVFTLYKSGGTRKFRKGGKRYTRKNMAGGAGILRGIAKRGEMLGEKRWNVEAAKQKQRALLADDEEEKAEYDKIYAKVYYQIAKRSRDAFDAALVESAVSSEGGIRKGGVLAYGSITAVCGAIAASAPGVWAIGTAALSTVVGASLAPLALTIIIPTLAAALVMGSGGFATGYTRAAEQHKACREIVAQLINERKSMPNPNNSQLNTKIASQIKIGKKTLFSKVNNPNFETAEVWMQGVANVISAGLLIAAKVAKNTIDKKITNQKKLANYATRRASKSGLAAPEPANGAAPEPANGAATEPANGAAPEPANGAAPAPANGAATEPTSTGNWLTQAKYVKPTINPYSGFTPDNTYIYFGHGSDQIYVSGDFVLKEPPSGCVYVNSTICGLTTAEPWDVKIIPAFINRSNDFLLDPFPTENEIKINAVLNLETCIPNSGSYVAHCFQRQRHLYEIAVYSGNVKYVSSSYQPLAIYPINLPESTLHTAEQKRLVLDYNENYILFGSPYSGVVSLKKMRDSTSLPDFVSTPLSYSNRLESLIAGTRTSAQFPLPGCYKEIQYGKFKSHLLNLCTYPSASDFVTYENDIKKTYGLVLTDKSMLSKRDVKHFQSLLTTQVDIIMKKYKGLHYNFLCRNTRASPEKIALRRAASVHQPALTIIDSFYQDNLEMFKETFKVFMSTKGVNSVRKLAALFAIEPVCKRNQLYVTDTLTKIFINSQNKQGLFFLDGGYKDKRDFLVDWVKTNLSDYPTICING